MTRHEYLNRNGLGALEDLSQDMERVFDSLLGRTVGTVLRGTNQDKFTPTLDVSDSDEAYMVYVDLPGVDPENVKVEMHDGKLTISGKREAAHEKSEHTYHRIERSSGNFVRAISLPGEVDIDQVDAQYTQGVLAIRLPKIAKQQPKKIQIRTQ